MKPVFLIDAMPCVRIILRTFVLFSLLALPVFSQAVDFDPPTARQLKTGDKHAYFIRAAENEFIEIVCERKGVDVALAIFSPAGESLSVSNAPGGFSGFDRVVFVAPKTGEYRLEVSARRPGAISGSYLIRFDARRAATENDAARAAAMKLSGQARELLRGAENRFEKATRALEKLEKAAALLEKSSDPQNLANVYFQIAQITANEFGDELKAVEIYEKALDLWRRIDDEPGRAICLMRAARELSDKGDREKALAYLKEALALTRKANDRLGEAAALSLLCRFYNDTGNFQKGFETCRESLRLGQNADPVTDYFTYSALAALYSNTGDAEKSLEYYRLTQERISLTGDWLNPIRLATAKSNIAGILFSQKKYTEALAHYEDALAVSRMVRRPKFEAYFLSRISLSYYALNRYEQALEYGEKSLALYRLHYARNRQGILNVLGYIYNALGDYEKARATLLESLEMNRQNLDRYAEAETLYNLAQLETKFGKPESALENVRGAINLSEILRADLLGKNQRSSYLKILERYYELKIDLLVSLYEKNPDPGYLEQAWQNQEKIRARSLLENFLVSGFDLSRPELKDFFAKEEDALETIAVAEMKRAEAVKTGNADARTVAERNLQKALDEYQIRQEEIRKKNPRFSALGLPQAFSFADAQNLLDEETAVLEFALGERQSYVWVIAKRSIRFFKLPARAEINRAALEFYLALTDREAKNETAVIEKSRRLSLQILQPAAKEIAGFKRLVTIADGSLQMIPFAALTLSENELFEPLVATREIVSAPSFSSLVFLRENKTKRSNKTDRTLAIFADPIFHHDDERIIKLAPKTSLDATAESERLAAVLNDFGVARLARLPFSGIEAREIARLAPQKTVLFLGSDASRQNFLRGDYASYRILHFATHGFLNQQNPDLSGLALSFFDQNRRPKNGFLRVIDLYSLRLNADLVVLSACQTALGKEVDGEGIVGLTHGFMYAGSSSVVASLWKVEDAAAAELMKRFYRALLKENQTLSSALRSAQNELRRMPRFANPRHWAGFTLTGEWK